MAVFVPLWDYTLFAKVAARISLMNDLTQSVHTWPSVTATL